MSDKKKCLNPNLKVYRQDNLVGPEGMLPISRSTFWTWVKEGWFPKPIKLGPRNVGWHKEDVHDFLDRLSDQWPPQAKEVSSSLQDISTKPELQPSSRKPS
jgi:prophage regulatory protein